MVTKYIKQLRKTVKITIKILGFIFLLLFAVFVYAYWYITTEWKKYYSNEDIKAMSLQINSSPALSDNYYNLYEILYSSDRHKSNLKVYTETFWDYIIWSNGTKHESAFAKAAYCFPQKYGMYPYPGFKLSWPIEKFTTPEKCFDFSEYKRNVYLKEAFPDALINDIEILNDTTEILKYFVIASAPTIYLNHNDKLDKEVAKLRAKIDAR